MKNKGIIRGAIFVGILLLGSLPFIGFAQSLDLPSQFAGLSSQDVKITIENIVQIVFGFLGILAVLLLLYGGFVWMTSAGNAEKIDRAKKIITSAVVGLLLILTSYAIASFIVRTVNEASGPPGGSGTPIIPPGPPAPPCPAPTGGEVVICQVSPGTPFIGDTITIRGWNFGTFVAGVSEVELTGSTSALATVVQCGAEEWEDTYIKVIVPTTLPPDSYTVEVRAAGGSCTDPGGVCRDVIVSSGAPSPSINCIDPDYGPRGQIVTIEGSNFGASPDTVEMQGDPSPVSATIGSWTDDTIVMTVPPDAITGDITVKRGPDISNPEPFTVTCSDAFNPASTECSTGCCSSYSCRESSVCDAVPPGTPGGPSISNLTPDKGEVGTYVTISGSSFGTTPGTVHVQINATDHISWVPSSCAVGAVWNDRQIVMELPATIGLGENGPAQVWVERADAAVSAPVNFTINDDPLRPGLCSVDINNGVFGDPVQLTGERFTGSAQQVLFGSTISGLNTTFTGDTIADTDVPNILAGPTALTVSVAGLSSNPLAFQVLPDAAGGPRIDYIDPTQGAESQFVGIYGQGFGSSVGVVQFINRASGVVVNGRIDFPPACGINFWRDDHILIKVPTGVNGDYDVRVQNAAGLFTNSKLFTKNTDALTPGICKVDPAQAPIGFGGVTFYGEGFGNQGSQSKITFYNGLDATSIGSWAPTQVSNVTVPAGAATGVVTLTNQDNRTSPGIPFEVGGSAPPVTPSGPSCTYRWSFTTGDLPFGLIIDQQCTVEAQSPSPYPFDQMTGWTAGDVDTNAPLNSVIAARFTTGIDYSTVQGNIIVRRCNESGSFSGCSSPSNVAGTFQPLGSNGFLFVPSGLLDDDTWYEVIIGTGLMANDGSFFQTDPDLGDRWHFHTRLDTQPQCQASSVVISPASRTVFVGDSGNFTSVAQSSSCNICNTSSLNWLWSHNAAQISMTSNLNQSTVVANTGYVGPTQIQATESFSGAVGSADIDITVGDPFVVGFTPGGTCEASCTNAQMTVSFNMPMATTGAGSVSDPNNIELRQCTDQNCASFTGGPLAASRVYVPAEKRVYLTPSTGLAANTWYRLIVKNSLTNPYNDALINLNYPIGSPTAFSWKFKTGNSSCDVDTITLAPAATTAFIGQSINYSGQTLATSVPGCGPIFVDPSSYTWQWTSSDPVVATIAETTPSFAVADALSASVTPISIEASLPAYPAVTPAVGSLTVSDAGVIPGPPVDPLVMTAVEPTGAGPYCRNVQIAATYNNPLEVGSSGPFCLSIRCDDNVTGLPLPPNLCDCIPRVAGNRLICDFVQDNVLQPLLPANATIRVDNSTCSVRDIYGQNWSSDGAPDGPGLPSEVWSFQTTENLCRISFVTVEPHPYIFRTANTTYSSFDAQAHDQTGLSIAGASYQWTGLNDNVLTVPADVDPAVDVTSGTQNGSRYAFVNASGSLGNPPVDIGSAKGFSFVTVDICEVPWDQANLTADTGPYIDPANSGYDFSLDYCVQRTANDPVLPELPQPLIRTGQGDVLKEIIWVVDPNKLGGAIGSGANNAPTISVPGAISVKVGELVYFQVAGRDQDGDQFTLRASSKPADASFNPFTGIFIWTPQETGSYTTTFEVDSDNDPSTPASNSDSVQITVTDGSSTASIPRATMTNPGNGVTIDYTVGQTTSASASSNLGPVEAFVWDFQDPGTTFGFAQSGTTVTAQHTWRQAGIYQVTLRVRVNGVWSQPAVFNARVKLPSTALLSPLQNLIEAALSLFNNKHVLAQAPIPQEKYDVIVVRVMKNLEHLDPMTWYRKFAPNPTGNPREITVDGYPAVQDGTTIYVGAGNISTTGPQPRAYTNIYLISYNADADSSTVSIVQQLVNSWKFNESLPDGTTFSNAPSQCQISGLSCNSDVECFADGDYCNSQKAVIRRDVKRYADLHGIARYVEEYAAEHKFCQNSPTVPCSTNAQCPNNGACVQYYPRFNSGTYIAGFSTSKWPSWSETLPDTLTAPSLPVDPINTFADCTAIDPGADPETCWNAVASQFTCIDDSNVYTYQVSGGGTGYQIAAHFETTDPSLVPTTVLWPSSFQSILLSLPSQCSSSPLSGICGNGITEGSEICDGGFTNACPASANNPYQAGCRTDCSGWNSYPAGWDCGGFCGNGTVNAPFEQCEPPLASLLTPGGWYCSLGGNISCNASCQFECTQGVPYNGQCGNGTVQLPEVCDDGGNNGSYGYCNSTCSGYGEYCGDGLINGSEECDTYQGLNGFSCPLGQTLFCDSSCQRSCDASGPPDVIPGICGNDIVEGAEQCEPDIYISPDPVDSTSAKQYVCGDTDTGENACKIVGGWCGDGRKQEPYESCDFSGRVCLGNPGVSCTTDADCPPAFIPPPPALASPGRCIASSIGNGTVCDNSSGSCEWCTNNCELIVQPQNYCGDGIIAGIEVCDDGELNGYIGFCNDTCTAGGTVLSTNICGNGIWEPPAETCDDGPDNGTPGMCNTSCSGITPGSLCGNGVPDPGEVCDDNGANGQPRQCDDDCGGYTPPVCGNTVIEDGIFGSEQCDDGNTNSGDGCDASCQNEVIPGSGGMCGDGTVQDYTRCSTQAGTPGHQCTANGDCNDLDRGRCYTAAGQLVTGSSCAFDSDCVATFGSGYFCREAETFDSNCTVPAENCDSGAANNGQPYYCWSDCSRDTLFCDDGIRSCTTCSNGAPNDQGVNEVCDDNGTNGTIVGGCNSSCTGTLTNICGNTIPEPPFEECDDGNTVSGDGCSSVCTNEVAAAACRNGVVEAGEICDPCVAPSNVSWCEDVGVGWCYRCAYICGDGIINSGWPKGECSGNGAACTYDYDCPAGQQCGGHCGNNNAFCKSPSDCSSTSTCVGMPFIGTDSAPGGEYCDDGDALNGTGVGACSQYCTRRIQSVCGDGLITGTETCDNNTPDESQSCTATVASPGSPIVNHQYPGSQIRECRSPSNGWPGGQDNPSQCIWDNWQACTTTMRCGDNVKNGTTEVCDGTDIDGKTCTDFGFVAGDVTCRSNCAGFTTSACIDSVCGDGNITGSEVCEGPNDLLRVVSCSASGTPGAQEEYCASDCKSKFTSSCEPFGLQIMSRQADVVYVNSITNWESLSLYDQCTVTGPDTYPGHVDPQGLAYPSASVSQPAGINACDGLLVAGSQQVYATANDEGPRMVIDGNLIYMLNERSNRPGIRVVDKTTLAELNFRQFTPTMFGRDSKEIFVDGSYIYVIFRDWNLASHQAYLTKLNKSDLSTALEVQFPAGTYLHASYDGNNIYLVDTVTNGPRIRTIRKTDFVEVNSELVGQSTAIERIESVYNPASNVLTMVYAHDFNSAIYAARKNFNDGTLTWITVATGSGMYNPRVVAGDGNTVYVEYFSSANSVNVAKIDWNIGAVVNSLLVTGVSFGNISNDIAYDGSFVYLVYSTGGAGGGLSAKVLDKNTFASVQAGQNFSTNLGGVIDLLVEGSTGYAAYVGTATGQITITKIKYDFANRVPFANYSVNTVRGGGSFAGTTGTGWERIGKNVIAVKLWNNGEADFQAVYTSKGIVDSGVTKQTLFGTVQSALTPNVWKCFNGGGTPLPSGTMQWWHRDYPDSSWVTPTEVSGCSLPSATVPIATWGSDKTCFDKTASGDNTMWCRLTYWVDP